MVGVWLSAADCWVVSGRAAIACRIAVKKPALWKLLVCWEPKINHLKPSSFFTYHQVYLLTYLLHGAESFLSSELVCS